MSSISGIGTGQQGIGALTATSTNGNVQADALKQEGVSDGPGAIRQDAATLTSLGGVMAQAVSDTDTNAAKVAALREAVAAGTYSVPTSAVADKLIESMGG